MGNEFVVERPWPSDSRSRIAWTMSFRRGTGPGAVYSVTRKRVPISSSVGGDRPASRQAALMHWLPLPHCSINPSS